MKIQDKEYTAPKLEQWGSVADLTQTRRHRRDGKDGSVPYIYGR